MQQAENAPNRRLGAACALAVVFIWSGYIVFSRAGMQTAMTAGDLVTLRFAVAGLLTLPFAFRWWPRDLGWHKQAVLALTGPGVAYLLLMFVGLGHASAAYAGVFANGTLPIFTAVLVWAFAGAAPGRWQIVAIGVILGGALLVALPELAGPADGTLRGAAYFLAASAVLSVYIFGLRRWRVTPQQALAVVNIPNMLVFLPIWYFSLPSGMAGMDLGTLVFQALFQGLGPGFLAVILFVVATANLGATPVAGFSAAVPASAALLALPVLGEAPSGMEWAGILIVTLGLLLLVRAPG